MKRNFILYCAVISLVLAAGTAMAADGIQGRLGVTGRLGFLVPENSEAFANPSKLETDVGFIGGGGFIYGINRNFAAELDITHTEFAPISPALEQAILLPPTLHWCNTASAPRGASSPMWAPEWISCLMTLLLTMGPMQALTPSLVAM
jgi:hypothetical protein